MSSASKVDEEMTAEFSALPPRPPAVGASVDTNASGARSHSSDMKVSDPSRSNKYNSRAQSPPLVTSRKSSRAGSLSDFPREGSEEAPLGYDVCESAGDDDDDEDASPYSERATPPYMRWAVDLQNVLEDFEGLQLFKKFLNNEGCGNELDFWYACKGLKQYSEKERPLIERVAHMIHQNYVRPQGEFSLTCIRGETRVEIQKKFVAKEVSQTMFNAAQLEVEAFLRIKHAAFVESDMYISYLQVIQTGGWDSPKCYSNESRSNSSSNSSSDAQRPSSTLLPTVHEEVENEAEQQQPQQQTTASAKVATTNTTTTTTASADNNSKQKKVDEGGRVSSGSKECPGPVCSLLTTSTSITTTAVSSSALVPSEVVTIPVRKKSSGQSTFGNRLTAGALVATLEQRMAYSACRSSRSGVPPNPYHTKYVPYLPTSAQDSELQSMSSDAATESSLSNSRYRHKERRIIRQHIEHNRDPIASQIFIPRTQREVVARDMMDEEFKVQVIEKLEHVRRERETYEKLNESLQRLSEPENNSNSHRAAVEKFCKVEKSFRAAPEDAEAILDDYYTRVGWKDSPKHSPMRSPGFAFGSRRKSPVSKSPDRRGMRIMTTSYPLPYAVAQTLPMHPAAVSMLRTSSSSQETHPLIQVPPIPAHLMSKHRSSSGHGNPTGSHRSSRAEGGSVPSGASQQQTQRGGQSSASSFVKNSKQFMRFPIMASDTSGISSGTSSDPSLVSAKIPSAASYNKPVTEQWIIEERPTQQSPYDSGERHRSSRVSSGVVNFGGKVYKSSSHKGSSNSESLQRNSNAEKSSRMHKVVAATNEASIGQGGNSRKTAGSRAAASGPQIGSSPASQPASHEYISVGYFLPNESTPYVTRFAGRQITLKQFKQLIPRKGNFRYFFQCASDELGTGMIQKEVTDESEVLPIWEGNKIVAKIVCVD
uniref:Axin-1 n=1 Tax=Trichuris muris TaxID=70415 RepID=A0A5S6QFE7_TRIMR